MATFTATAAQTNASGFFLNPPRYIENGVVSRSAAFNFALAQSAGDVIQMVPIPRGAMVIDIVMAASNMGGANFTYGVGDGNSTTRYLNSQSTSANGPVARPYISGSGYSYSADDTIDVIMQTAGSASAVGTLRLTVLYQFDNATDGNS